MRRRSKFAATFALAFVTLLATGCVGVRNALTDPIERTATFRLAALPRSSRPVRIALLSDIHVGNFVMTRERLEHIVSEVNVSHPDVVLLAGDFVIGEEREGTAARTLDLAPLSNLKAKNGIFAVLGNHDHWTDPQAIRSALHKAKIVVL